MLRFQGIGGVARAQVVCNNLRESLAFAIAKINTLPKETSNYYNNGTYGEFR
jgi:hypothetical protein